MIQDAAIGELIEEARPANKRGLYSPEALRDCITGWHTFDDQNRSARGRMITTAYVFELPDSDEVTVTAGDDAGAASWHEIDGIEPAEFFEDHYHII